MKKLALSVILGASLMVSSSAFGLEAMSDSTMKSATGQAGVTIAIDDVTLYQAVGQTIYRDTDGLGGTSTNAIDEPHSDAAGIYIDGAETLTTIRAIFAEAGNREGFLAADYDAIALANGMDGTNGTTVLTSKALTIDVARSASIMTQGKKFNVDTSFGLPAGATSAHIIGGIGAQVYAAALAAGNVPDGPTAGTPMTEAEFLYVDAAGGDLTLNAPAKAGIDSVLSAKTDGKYTDVVEFGTLYDNFAVSGVVIGLPTIEIAKSGSVKSIGITAEGSSFNNNRDFIKIKKTDSTLAILGGTLEIVAH